MPLARKRHNLRVSEDGQAILLIVFSILGILGLVALAVDGGRILLERRSAQNAADSTALGAALARIRDPQGGWVDQAFAIAKQNGYEGDGVNNSVNIYSPPIAGKYVGDVEYIQVIISSRVRTYFGGVIGIRGSTVVAEAISRTKAPELTQMLDGNVVVSLRPTSECTGNPHDAAFWIRGEATFNITGGGIFINSNNPDCALMQNGSGSIRLQDPEAQIKVVGGADVKRPQLLTPFPPVTNSAPIPYPPPFFMPQVGCGKPAEVSPDGFSMTAGDWSEGDFPPKGVTYLGPGVYCIVGSKFVAGEETVLEGKDVVFVIEEGKVNISPTAEISLSAPDSGELAGLLFYQPMDNREPMVINGSKNSAFRGAILAPAAEIHINNNFSNFGFHSQIIGYSIHANGTSDIKITYVDEENYDAYTMPEVYLIK